MGQDARKEALIDRHHQLEAMLEREESRPLPDFSLVNEWKRQKLRIKDELYSLDHH